MVVLFALLSCSKSAPNQPGVLSLRLAQVARSDARAGDPVKCGLHWSVGGNAAATNAVITDTIPDGATVAAVDQGATTSGRTVTWRLGTRQPGESGTIRLTLLLTAPTADSAVIATSAAFHATAATPAVATARITVFRPRQVIPPDTNLKFEAVPYTGIFQAHMRGTLVIRGPASWKEFTDQA